LLPDVPPRHIDGTMLEKRWRQIVATRGGDWAVHDVSDDRRWTFAELARLADTAAITEENGCLYPCGQGIAFIVTVLQAWRTGQVVCPLEPNQLRPKLPRPPAAVAHLKLTSGTTGAPKWVRFSEAQLAADPDAIVVTMGLHPGSPNLGVISLAHSYGFSNLVLPLLLHGIPLVLVPSPLPAALWAAAQCYPEVPLTLPAVPALWRAWHEAQAIPRNVGLAISAGAPLSLPLEQAVFQEQGLKLHNFLGASECGGIAYDATQTPRTDARLAGTPLQGVRLNQGLNGCLEVCGPAAGTGYWPEEDGPLQQGVFRTSDLVELSPEGAVHLRGRLSDVIQIAGRKVSPETIEVVLREHGSVRDCLVLGVPSGEARGEAVAAVIELASDVPEAILRRHLQDRLPAWQVPRLWVRVDSLGVNGRGKRSRAEWRERLPEMKMGW